MLFQTGPLMKGQMIITCSPTPQPRSFLHRPPKVRAKDDMDELCALPKQPTNPRFLDHTLESKTTQSFDPYPGRNDRGSPAGCTDTGSLTISSTRHTVAEITNDLSLLVRTIVRHHELGLNARSLEGYHRIC